MRGRAQGLVKLHSVDPELSARHLAAAFHTVAQHLGAQQEGVVFGSAECLKTLLRACVDTQMVQLAVRQAALAQQEGDDGPSNRCDAQAHQNLYQRAGASILCSKC